MATIPKEIQLGYGIRAKLKGVIDKIHCHGYSYSQAKYIYTFTTYGVDEMHNYRHSFKVGYLPSQISENYLSDVCEDIIFHIKSERGLT